MKRLILSLCCLCAAVTYAQKDSITFKGYFYNKEYGVYLRINFYGQNIIIPGQEMLGGVPGYLGKDRNSFAWPIVSANIKGKKASLQMVNDYGSALPSRCLLTANGRNCRPYYPLNANNRLLYMV